LAFYVLLYFLKVLLAIIFRIIHISLKSNLYIKKVFLILENGTYFCDILSIFIEGYIDILISSYYNLTMKLNTTNGEIIAYYFSIFNLSVSLGIIVPLLVFIPFQG